MDVADPLQHGAPMPFTREFHPLGFPLRLITNSRAVLEAAADSWGRFPAAFVADAVELRVLVEEGAEEPRPPLFRAQRHLMAIVSGAGNFAVCDHTRRFCFGRLSSAAAGDREFVRYYFLDAMAYHTLTQLHLTPMHAACVTRGGRAVMLCGPSGAGKSTLAYACTRRGWTYVADNESWLLRADARTVLGNPTRIRLRDTAVSLFPELAGRPAVTFNGKQSILLDTAGMEIAFACRPERIVFLDRSGGTPSVKPLPKEEACARLFSWVIRYEPEVREQHEKSIGRFVETAAVELRYDGLDDAVAALERMIA